SPVFLGDSSANAPLYDTSPWKEIILFGLMIFGMAARTLSLAIEQRRRAKGKPHELDIDVWDFVYPFLVSFITFGAIMGQIGSSPLSLTSMVIAFQNGFFWQTRMKPSK